MASKIKIAVLASGAGTLLQSIIDSVESGKLDAEIACVVSDVSSAKALERARKHQIPSLFLDPAGKKREEYYSSLALELKKRGVQLVDLAGFMRIIPQSFLKEFPNAVINNHPALLPGFPGIHSVRQALEHGVKITGCTVHFVTPDLDAGPIILQKAVEVLEDDSEEILSEKIKVEERKLLPKAIALIAQGRVKIEGRKVRIDWKGFEDKWK